MVRIADPEMLADAALSLLNDPVAWHAASQSAVQRVEKYYTQELLFEQYLSLYEKNFKWQA